METVPKAIVSFPVVLMAVCIVAYFRAPEKFFIERLRPRDGGENSHSQLVSRAFVGVTISMALLMVWAVIMPSRDSLLEWPDSFYSFSFVFALYIGASSYLYFRLRRYRRLAPQERGSRDRSAPERREARGADTWPLRGELVALFISVGIIGIPALHLIMNLLELI